MSVISAAMRAFRNVIEHRLHGYNLREEGRGVVTTVDCTRAKCPPIPRALTFTPRRVTGRAKAKESAEEKIKDNEEEAPKSRSRRERCATQPRRSWKRAFRHSRSPARPILPPCSTRTPRRSGVRSVLERALVAATAKSKVRRWWWGVCPGCGVSGEG